MKPRRSDDECPVDAMRSLHQDFVNLVQELRTLAQQPDFKADDLAKQLERCALRVDFFADYLDPDAVCSPSRH